MPSDITRPKRLTIRDLRTINRMPERTQREPPSRPLKPPAAPRPRLADVWPPPPPEAASEAAEVKRMKAALAKLGPPRAAPPPRPVPPPPAPPPPAPGGKTEVRRAKDRRHRAKWRAKHELPQAEVLAVLTALGARYPCAFGAGLRPLAIGIHHQIAAETGTDPRLLGAALRRWCYRDAYLAAVVEGSHRHGLDGTPVTELTDEERAAAAVQLAALRAAMKRRKP